MTSNAYSSMLNAGIGMIEETRILLKLWQPGMSSSELHQIALQSGSFPNITARRLRNFIFEAFNPRYLVNNEAPAKLLKSLLPFMSSKEFNQLLMIFSCRESRVLYDFISNEYWNAYSSGKETVSNKDASLFARRANQEGKTVQPWSDSTVQRVGRYLTSSCADFGLLESGQKAIRKILPFKIETNAAVALAYDLHFAGHGDNRVLSHPDWALFGMERMDVLNEFKRLALKGWWIVQSAGEVTRIGWQYSSMEAVTDALTTQG